VVRVEDWAKVVARALSVILETEKNNHQNN